MSSIVALVALVAAIVIDETLAVLVSLVVFRAFVISSNVATDSENVTPAVVVATGVVSATIVRRVGIPSTVVVESESVAPLVVLVFSTVAVDACAVVNAPAVCLKACVVSAVVAEDVELVW